MSMSVNGQHNAALAEFVKQRRISLGLSQREAAERASISVNSYRAVEKGEEVRFTTLDAIDKALNWTLGSAREILDGGVPHQELDFELPEQIVEDLSATDAIDSEVFELDHELGMKMVAIVVVPKGMKISQIREAVGLWTKMKAEVRPRFLAATHGKVIYDQPPKIRLDEIYPTE